MGLELFCRMRLPTEPKQIWSLHSAFLSSKALASWTGRPLLEPSLVLPQRPSVGQELAAQLCCLPREASSQRQVVPLVEKLRQRRLAFLRCSQLLEWWKQ